jgi:two-component system chemotaxis sensor kinase CheA
MSAPDPEVLEIFREEANERLDAIVDALLAAEDGGSTPAAVDQLFRDAHTIKGSADMLGLDDVKQLAHAVEDLLHQLRPQGVVPPGLADPLLRAADAIRALVNGNGPARPDIVEELAARLAATDGEPTEPAAVPTEDSEPEQPASPRRSLRVPAAKLDRLLDLVGESVLHRQRLVQSLHDLGAADGSLQDELDHGDRLLGELQGAAIEARTLPLGTITGGFPRAVRDIAVENGKDVQLVVEGEKTELDRVILERLSDPIVHLLRNAVAHGIEPPAERERQGSPPAAGSCSARSSAAASSPSRWRTTDAAFPARPTWRRSRVPGSRPRTASPSSPAAASGSAR